MLLSARELHRRLITDSPLVQAPERLRALVRASELGLVLVAAAIGCVSGVLVSAIGMVAQAMHELLFGLPHEQRLSSASGLWSIAVVLVPTLGGVLLGLVLLVGARLRKRPAVDPIEANALHGGRMSLKDSLLVTVQNLISNGFGASVGLEAGYTQICAGVASRLGLVFEMRRNDLRTLVGCGAAAAIAAAFNAPLTGAFYAFELIIGTYAIGTLAPVVVAALASTLSMRVLVGRTETIDVGVVGTVSNADYLPALTLGFLCAGVGILIMQGVTVVEGLVRRTPLPPYVRPTLGGLIVGALALLTPQVLSAGHGALRLQLDAEATASGLLLLLVLKATASAVSIGTGFRGGLFFAALFLGALLGKLFALAAPALFATATVTPVIYAVVGMSALAVAIIGGPLTMTFLALEATGDFPITVLVLVAVIASSLTVRKTFGYSFATWRFHLRGESIRSAHDVGWIRTLTVGQLMRRDVRPIRDDTMLSAFRRDFPLGSTQRVIAIDEAERYAGIVLVPEAHAEALDDAQSTTRIRELLRWKNDFLLPQLNAKQAAELFDAAESEALAVVDGRDTRKVIGLLTESHTLRRYSEELDKRRREMAGEA
jgi:CIC family chloride channel protein